MSETQILKKLTAPTIKVSSDDPHKIIGAPPAPPKPGTPAAAAAAQRAKRTGVPIQPTPSNVQIGTGPRIAHVTSSSSSHKSEIKGAPPVPPAVKKAQEQRAKDAASKAQVSDHLPDDPAAAPRLPKPPQAPQGNANAGVTVRAKHEPEGPSRGNPQRGAPGSGK